MARDNERGREGVAPEALPAGTVCRLLAHPVRRECVRLLAAEDRTVRVEELIELLLQESPGSVAPDTDREQLRISLVHVHLPDMEVNGLVRWDREGERIEYRVSERVEDVLDLIEEWE